MNTTIPVRLGIVSSSGGSALAAASDCLAAAGKRVEWVVITDRQCGLEHWARSRGHAVHRLAYQDAESFSSEACAIFRIATCKDVLLFFTRRVASPLIDQTRVWNIHPALLPAFRGLHGVRDAVAAGVRLLGATLHRVDADLDAGPIVAQVAAPLLTRLSLEEAEHLSYLQKVWLTLIWFDQLAAPHGQPASACCSPGVTAAYPGFADKRLYVSYVEWLARAEGVKAT